MSSVNAKWLTSSQHIPYALRQRVKNDSGADIAKNAVVVATNVAPEGNFMKVGAATPLTDERVGSRMMVAVQKIANGKRGDVVPWTLLTSQNTSSYSAGGAVYLAASGALTHTRPSTSGTGPSLTKTTTPRIVGRCLVVSATVGVIMLDPNGETGSSSALIVSGQATLDGSGDADINLGAAFANAIVVTQDTHATPTASSGTVNSSGEVTFYGTANRVINYIIDGR